MGAVHKKRVVRRHTERTLRELNAPSEYWHRQSPELLVKLAVKERGLSPWVEPTQIKDYRAITKILRRVYWYRDMAKNQVRRVPSQQAPRLSAVRASTPCHPTPRTPAACVCAVRRRCQTPRRAFVCAR